MQKKYRGLLCEKCPAVLSDFTQKRCPECKFAAVYIDHQGKQYYVSAAWINNKRCYTVYQQTPGQKRRFFKAIPYQYRYIEAQTLLNVHANQHGWKTVQPAERRTKNGTD